MPSLSSERRTRTRLPLLKKRGGEMWVHTLCMCEDVLKARESLAIAIYVVRGWIYVCMYVAFCVFYMWRGR